mgnify:CR=1 FL=1
MGAKPAEQPYSTISLIGSSYWFAYFLVILPLLGITETPLEPPASIEEDFNNHYPTADNIIEGENKETQPTAVPAEWTTLIGYQHD